MSAERAHAALLPGRLAAPSPNPFAPSPHRTRGRAPDRACSGCANPDADPAARTRRVEVLLHRVHLVTARGGRHLVSPLLRIRGQQHAAEARSSRDAARGEQRVAGERAVEGHRGQRRRQRGRDQQGRLDAPLRLRVRDGAGPRGGDGRPRAELKRLHGGKTAGWARPPDLGGRRRLSGARKPPRVPRGHASARRGSHWRWARLTSVRVPRVHARPQQLKKRHKHLRHQRGWRACTRRCGRAQTAACRQDRPGPRKGGLWQRCVSRGPRLVADRAAAAGDALRGPGAT